MPIAATDLKPYGSVNRPEDDTATVGGAIQNDDQPNFTQWSANAVVAIISDGADVRTLTAHGRDAAGALVSEGPTALNGAVEVVFTTTFERITKIVMTVIDAARIVDIRQGSGGTVRGQINGPDANAAQLTLSSFFVDSASESGIAIRFEKFFWRNNHGSLTLNAATVDLTADPDSRIRFGIEAAKDDTNTATNRKTAPGGITFFDDSNAQAIAGNTLESGSRQGVWIEQNLPASDTAHRATFTTELAGTTV